MVTLIFEDEVNRTNVAYKTTMVNFFDQNFLISNIENVENLGNFNQQLVNLLPSVTSSLSVFVRLAMQFDLTLWGIRSDNKVLYVKNGVAVNALQGHSIEPVQTGSIVVQTEDHFTSLSIGNEVYLNDYPISNYHIQVYRNGRLQMPIDEYLIQGHRIEFVRAFGYGQNQKDVNESVSVYYTKSIPI